MENDFLKLYNISKSFDDTEVLKDINLTVNKGEFITLLGPSGCGKTTTLRIIAGLEEPDSGSVILDNIDVTRLQPNLRNVNTVFQNYALFPHMTVEKNIAYGLKIKGVSKSKTKKLVKEALEFVQLEGFEKRRVTELSGGQKQRVAIARTIVNKPKVLLLDEPLSSLDYQLRHQMQTELKAMQKKLGITFVYITHDQEEALTMSDRIAVMNEGVFVQIGTPKDIYHNPKTSFVATFVGSANIVEGVVREIKDGIVVFENECGTGTALLEDKIVKTGQTVRVAVRSEHILLNEPECHFSGSVDEKNFAGGMLRISLNLDCGQRVVASRHGIDSALTSGDSITLGWAPENAVFVDLDDEQAD